MREKEKEKVRQREPPFLLTCCTLTGYLNSVDHPAVEDGIFVEVFGEIIAYCIHLLYRCFCQAILLCVRGRYYVRN